MSHHSLSSFFIIISLYFLLYPVQTLSISGYGIKDLEGNDELTFQKEADWWNLTTGVSSAKITQTTSMQKWLLGGPGILGVPARPSDGSSFKRSFQNLPPHSFVGITAVFWYFDSLWEDRTIPFDMRTNSINGVGPQLGVTDFTVFYGGKSGERDLGRAHIKFGFPHNKKTLEIGFKNLGNSNSNDQSFGFRELHIHLSNVSHSFDRMCQISEDKNPLQYDQCDCLLNQAKDSNGNCVNCAAHCDICYGPGDSECLACAAGTFWNGTKCNTCDISCQTCTGPTANECPTCKYGFYNYGNNTCRSECEPPFQAVEQVGLDKYCGKMCGASQFYWSFSQKCIDSCDPPLVHAPDENGIETCFNPCSDPSQYLYGNGSCYDTCKPPLLMVVHDMLIRTCINPCSGTDYLYSNRSCLSDCHWPLISRVEPGVKYCSNPCLSTGQFLYNNGSCLSTCPAPLISRSEPGVKYCHTPCDSVSDYIYDNRSCSATCSSPLLSRTEAMVAKYCLSPCLSASYFLYPNGTCLTDCMLPLRSKTERGVKFCYSPCSASSDYIYSDGSCKTTCPSPLMSYSEPDFRFCFNPCHETQYLYSDQSCHTSCYSPLIVRQESGVQYCRTPCVNANEYIYTDGTCETTCEYPHKVVNNPVYKVCSMNLNEIQIRQARSIAIGTEIADTISGIGGILTGFLAPGDPTSMLMWSLLKMFESIKYLDVKFPGQLTAIFSKQNDHFKNGDGYMSSIAKGDNRSRVLSQNDYQEKPMGKLSYYNIPSNFLDNYWQQLIVFACFIILLIVSAILLRFFKNPQYIKVVKHIKSALQWNIILMFFCGSYGDLVLYSALELQTISFKSLKETMSFIICLVMVLLAIFVPIKILYVVHNIRRTQATSPEKKWISYKVFFESYKTDQISQHIFLVIYLLRVAIFNIIIGFIFKSPMAQAILINLLNFIIMAYLVLKNPLKDKICFVQHLAIESMLLIYHICLLILAFMDHSGSQAEGTRAFFGGIMVVFLITGPIATALLIIFKLFLMSKDIYYRYKAQKEATELVGPAFRFRKVRARGDFIVGDQESNNTGNTRSLHHGPTIEMDESNLIGISHQDRSRDMERNLIGAMKDQISIMEALSLEKNIPSSSGVQIYTRIQKNSKRRKINLFRDNFVPPD